MLLIGQAQPKEGFGCAQRRMPLMISPQKLRCSMLNLGFTCPRLRTCEHNRLRLTSVFILLSLW